MGRMDGKVVLVTGVPVPVDPGQTTQPAGIPPVVPAWMAAAAEAGP